MCSRCSRSPESSSSPARRFDPLISLAEVGVPTGVAIAPLLPGLNDTDVPGILKRAAAADATTAFILPVRLACDARPVFEERLRLALPGRANNADFGERMRGAALGGARAALPAALQEAGARPVREHYAPRGARPVRGGLFSS